uniref:Uncharacterized protein n=1 Tax=Arundo donax TaxID=35708 RepID=A0A0A8YDX4_ARUDO
MHSVLKWMQVREHHFFTITHMKDKKTKIINIE